MADSRPSPPLTQPPLELDPRSLARLENFVAAERNRELFALLQRMAAADQAHSVHIYGPHGEGRSHLLQGVCRALNEAGETAYYLPLKELPAADLAHILQGLEHGRALCLDDLEHLAGCADAERALFHFLNRRREQRGLLLSTSLQPLRALDFRLPDLASRLDASLSYRLHPLEEERQRALFHRRAAECDVNLKEEAVDFIFRRARRNTGALLQALECLQYHSLAQQRRITVPLVKEVCGW